MTRNPACLRASALKYLLPLMLLAGAAPLALARPHTATAHPLGNFTVNRYARVEPGAASVRVVYALDMAEIPTFQEMSALDRDHDNAVSDTERQAYLDARLPELAHNLTLTVSGKPLTLRPLSGSITLGDGQGGLQVLRLDAVFETELPSGLRGGVLDARLRDTNYDNRVGWKEIVVRGTAGAAVRDSSVPAWDASDALRSYPEDALQSPLEVREASFQFEPGVADPDPSPNPSPARGGENNAARPATERTPAASRAILSGFARSAAARDLTLPVIAVSLLAAMFWGALHALGPGHGKTVVAAYLVGSRGTARHAVFLGLTVTATHTAGVYLLGFITLSASHFIVPERLYPVLSFASGLVVVAMGLSLLVGRLRAARVWPFNAEAPRRAEMPRVYDTGSIDSSTPPRLRASALKPTPHKHGNHHGHEHGHAHHHDHSAPVSWRGLLALGVYGGLIPCPTAIVVLLTSISLNRVGFGLLLVVAFSAGLAAVLTGIGLMLVYAGRALSRFKVNGAVVRAVPVVSAAVVVVVGMLITLNAAGAGRLPAL